MYISYVYVAGMFGWDNVWRIAELKVVGKKVWQIDRFWP